MWKIVGKVDSSLDEDSKEYKMINLICPKNHIFLYFSDLDRNECYDCGSVIPAHIKIQAKLLF